MTPEVRGVVNVYRGHLARYRALQQVTGIDLDGRGWWPRRWRRTGPTLSRRCTDTGSPATRWPGS